MVARVKLMKLSTALDDDVDPATGKKYFTKGGEGGPGRRPGTSNKMTRVMKDAILLAAEQHGSDGKGKDGLQGYLYRLAKREPRSFAGLLGKLLPFQITGKDGVPLSVMLRTKDEVAKEMRERGLPVPAAIFDQAVEVKRAREEAKGQTQH